MVNQNSNPAPDPRRMAEIRKNILAFHARHLRQAYLLRTGLACGIILLTLLSIRKLREIHRRA